jgi:prepilin-type N-terminal cleavage/methylation domain-containing protein
VRSTSISEVAALARSRGFTLIELLVGLALALTITAAVAPLWFSLESAGARETDRTVHSLQGRVAVARLERDLRLASAAGCPFSVSAPILEASDSQVVFLLRTEAGGAPTLVEWEIVNGTLMRRWGVCPPLRPSVFKHTLYLDHKTMLENVAPGSGFRYVVEGVPATEPILGEQLDAIEAVLLDARSIPTGGGAGVDVKTTARVAR